MVAPALGIDALDGFVVTADLGTRLRGAVAVVDDAHDGEHGTRDALERFAQQDRMVLDACAQFRVHVLDRADPHPQHAGAQIAEVLPGERIGPERTGRWHARHRSGRALRVRR